jgi:hypothetical protein
MRSIELNYDHSDTQDGCLSGCGQLKGEDEDGHPVAVLLAERLCCDPWTQPCSVAREINIPALDISLHQLYAQLVPNIGALLSLR